MAPPPRTAKPCPRSSGSTIWRASCPQCPQYPAGPAALSPLLAPSAPVPVAVDVSYNKQVSFLPPVPIGAGFDLGTRQQQQLATSSTSHHKTSRGYCLTSTIPMKRAALTSTTRMAVNQNGRPLRNPSLQRRPQTPRPLTAVVAGGTHGIGHAFLTSLATLTPSPKIYILGRTDEALASLVSTLQSLNPTGTYIPILAPDLTLVTTAHAAARSILAAEGPSGKVDILFLSPGYLSFRGRDASPEGLDRLMAIRLYSRMQLIIDLIPLLQRSPLARVVTVLAAGKEGPVFPEDLETTDPKHAGPSAAAGVATTYTTLFLEQLAQWYPGISFVHTFPGIVKTNLFNNPEHFGPVFRFVVNRVVAPVVAGLLAIPAEEVGARHVWYATSPTFVPAEKKDSKEAAVGSNGKKGSGVYTVNEKSETIQSDKVLRPYRESGIDQKIWDHVQTELKRIIGPSHESGVGL
ncbi:hypothetical protein B0H67DRAFT_553403 [Lasiosphaeris hirsuta]|uniref:Uncharacterized protein n=1 Tax=Lasiosphaeris hirsuta TaxID=260670 RepID=A0AA40AF96_9PEZI|nr:hypothetical protein B0H67DRAFT_553403 [Lasiosphaeris hirsuta]